MFGLTGVPVIGSRDLARRLQAEQPGLPVIFMSGYTDEEVVRSGRLRELLEGALRQA